MRLIVGALVVLSLQTLLSMPVLAQPKVSLKDLVQDKRTPAAKRDPKKPEKKNTDADAFDKFVKEVMEALEKLPDSFKRCLIKCNVKILLTDFVTDGIDKGDDVTERPEGSTYGEIQRVNIRNSNKLILARKYKDSRRISHITERPALVASHEVGHAIDRCAKDFSKTKEFTDAFNTDWGNYKNLKRAASEKTFAETFNGDDGPQEAFASVFSMLHGFADKDRDPFLKKAFPNVIKLMERLFKECPDETPKIDDGPAGGGEEGGGKKKKELKDCIERNKTGKPPSDGPSNDQRDGAKGLPMDGPISNAPSNNIAAGTAQAVSPIKIEVFGDGAVTGHCELVLTSRATGHATSTELATMCVSGKSKKPPGVRDTVRGAGLEYRLADSSSPDVVAIVKAAKRLAEVDAYGQVPLAEQKRMPTIAQLAVWKHIGSNAPDADKVTKEVIKSDILSHAKIAPRSLTSAEHKALDNRVDAILNAVDLTLKETEDPRLPEQPKAPETCPQPGSHTPKKPEETSGHQPEEHGKNHNPDEPNTTAGPGKPGQPGGPGHPIPTPLGVLIPEYTVFVPNDDQYQCMMTVTDEYIDCPEEITDEH